ncbi:UNVERIFIED_CONTAM: hypothetical protein FKN15_016442 [Acipenser sinensis]
MYFKLPSFIPGPWRHAAPSARCPLGVVSAVRGAGVEGIAAHAYRCTDVLVFDVGGRVTPTQSHVDPQLLNLCDCTARSRPAGFKGECKQRQDCWRNAGKQKGFKRECKQRQDCWRNAGKQKGFKRECKQRQDCWRNAGKQKGFKRECKQRQDCWRNAGKQKGFKRECKQRQDCWRNAGKQKGFKRECKQRQDCWRNAGKQKGFKRECKQRQDCWRNAGKQKGFKRECKQRQDCWRNAGKQKGFKGECKQRQLYPSVPAPFRAGFLAQCADWYRQRPCGFEREREMDFFDPVVLASLLVIAGHCLTVVGVWYYRRRQTPTLEDERDRVQKKTFMKWVNKHLIKKLNIEGLPPKTSGVPHDSPIPRSPTIVTARTSPETSRHVSDADRAGMGGPGHAGNITPTGGRLYRVRESLQAVLQRPRLVQSEPEEEESFETEESPTAEKNIVRIREIGGHLSVVRTLYPRTENDWGAGPGQGVEEGVFTVELENGGGPFLAEVLLVTATEDEPGSPVGSERGHSLACGSEEIEDSLISDRRLGAETKQEGNTPTTVRSGGAAGVASCTPELSDSAAEITDWESEDWEGAGASPQVNTALPSPLAPRPSLSSDLANLSGAPKSSGYFSDLPLTSPLTDSELLDWTPSLDSPLSPHGGAPPPRVSTQPGHAPRSCSFTLRETL